MSKGNPTQWTSLIQEWMASLKDLHHSPDKLGGKLGHDGVAVAFEANLAGFLARICLLWTRIAAWHHSTGKPKSQRLNAGANAAGFPVSALDEVGVDPGVKAATLGNWSSRIRSVPSGFVPVVAMSMGYGFHPPDIADPYPRILAP